MLSESFKLISWFNVWSWNNAFLIIQRFQFRPSISFSSKFCPILSSWNSTDVQVFFLISLSNSLWLYDFFTYSISDFSVVAWFIYFQVSTSLIFLPLQKYCVIKSWNQWMNLENEDVYLKFLGKSMAEFFTFSKSMSDKFNSKSMLVTKFNYIFNLIFKRFVCHYYQY